MRSSQNYSALHWQRQRPHRYRLESLGQRPIPVLPSVDPALIDRSLVGWGFQNCGFEVQIAGHSSPISPLESVVVGVPLEPGGLRVIPLESVELMGIPVAAEPATQGDRALVRPASSAVPDLQSAIQFADSLDRSVAG